MFRGIASEKIGMFFFRTVWCAPHGNSGQEIIEISKEKGPTGESWNYMERFRKSTVVKPTF
jgi:hypothetical protein